MQKRESWGRRAVRWYLEWSPVIAGVLLLFSAGFFAGVLSVDAAGFLVDPVTIQWATAIATVLAAIVAIGIALHTDRRKSQDARNAGQLIAAKQHDLFAPIILNLQRMSALLPKGQPPDATAIFLYKSIDQDLDFVFKQIQEIDADRIGEFDPALRAMVYATSGQLKVAMALSGWPGQAENVAAIISESLNRMVTAQSLARPAFDRLIGSYLAGMVRLKP